MSFADDNPGYRINSDEQARNWLDGLMKDLESSRAVLDQLTFDRELGKEVSPKEVQKAHRVFLVRHGGCLGTLTALHRCGRITDTAYAEMRQRILATIAPKTGSGIILAN